MLSLEKSIQNRLDLGNTVHTKLNIYTESDQLSVWLLYYIHLSDATSQTKGCF